MGWCATLHGFLCASLGSLQYLVMPRLLGNVLLWCVVLNFFLGGSLVQRGWVVGWHRMMVRLEDWVGVCSSGLFCRWVSSRMWGGRTEGAISSCITVSCCRRPCLRIIPVSRRNAHGLSHSNLAFSCFKGHPGGNQVDGLPPALSTHAESRTPQPGRNI